MAKSQSDLFSFLITPEFDTQSVTDSGKYLEQEVKEIAEKISKQVSKVMGEGFSFPANFKKDDINEVTKLVESLGGSVKRVGENIVSSFKDANGTTTTLKQSIKDAIDVAEEESVKVAQAAGKFQEVINIRKQFEQLRASSSTYTGSEQIKQQNEIEKQIIQNLEKRYQYEIKIKDAQQQGNTAQKTYYEKLKDMLTSERTTLEGQLSAQNTAAKQNIKNTEDELRAKANLYQQMLNNKKVAEDAAQTEQNNLKQSLELLNQYESVKSKIDAAETSGQKGSAYYQELETQLKDIIASMQAYGIEVDKTTGKLVFKDTATNAVKAKENVDQLNKELKETNTTLDTQKAKAKDQTLINSIKEYVKQYKALQSLEASGKQDTQAYKDTQAAMQTLIQTLKQYGVEIQTDANGTQQFVVAQKTQKNQTDKVNSVLREQNTVLAQSGEKQNTFSKSIQDSVENFIKYQVAMEAINKLTSEFTSAIYDMNEAMTQVRMVTMGSYEDTVQLADSYTQLAKQLGTTTTTVAEGADTWLNV